MKILVCGLGSIGLRHTKNLLNLGYKDILLVSSRNFKNNKLKNLKKFRSLKIALKEKPKLAIICNSTHLHEDTISECLRNNINTFVEKPVGYNRKKLKKLLSILNKKREVNNMVGYMMRFHPAVIKIKKLLKKNTIGEIFHYSSHWGEYLPHWHKNENFRNSYAANKTMGGGVSLTLSHDLDLSCYFFNKITSVELIKNRINSLKIKAESAVDFLANFEKNITGFIHLNYLQKRPSRMIKIIGTNGSIEFDYYKNLIILIKNKSYKKIYIKNFKRNNMFIEELKYVLKCIKNNKKMEPNLKDSISLLKNFKLI